MILLIAGMAALRGNPVASPTVIMTAENVVASTTTELVIVAGRYRFRATEWAVPDPAPRHLPFRAFFQLPIPVPETTEARESLAIQLVPELTVGPETIKGSVVGVFPELPRTDGVKFIAVEFFFEAHAQEFEVIVKYQQPVIRRNGRLFAHYIPLLPNFESNKKRYGLKEESYVISFEAHQGSTLKFNTPGANVLQSSPKLVSIRPLHREVLEVEILPGNRRVSRD